MSFHRRDRDQFVRPAPAAADCQHARHSTHPTTVHRRVDQPISPPQQRPTCLRLFLPLGTAVASTRRPAPATPLGTRTWHSAPPSTTFGWADQPGAPSRQHWQRACAAPLGPPPRMAAAITDYSSSTAASTDRLAQTVLQFGAAQATPVRAERRADETTRPASRHQQRTTDRAEQRHVHPCRRPRCTRCERVTASISGRGRLDQCEPGGGLGSGDALYPVKHQAHIHRPPDGMPPGADKRGTASDRP